MENMELNAVEKAFVAEYMANGKNATQAYLKVKPGVSYNSSKVYAGKILKRPAVQAEIDRLTNEKVSDKIMSYEQCLVELTKIAMSSSDTIKIKAIAEINKMMGHYQQTLNINKTEENPFDNMSADEIQAFLMNLGDDDDGKDF